MHWTYRLSVLYSTVWDCILQCICTGKTETKTDPPKNKKPKTVAPNINYLLPMNFSAPSFGIDALSISRSERKGSSGQKKSSAPVQEQDFQLDDKDVTRGEPKPEVGILESGDNFAKGSYKALEPTRMIRARQWSDAVENCELPEKLKTINLN